MNNKTRPSLHYRTFPEWNLPNNCQRIVYNHEIAATFSHYTLSISISARDCISVFFYFDSILIQLDRVANSNHVISIVIVIVFYLLYHRLSLIFFWCSVRFCSVCSVFRFHLTLYVGCIMWGSLKMIRPLTKSLQFQSRLVCDIFQFS